MKTFPDLFHKDKIGRIRRWKVWADGPTVYTEYGLLDGEKQISSKDVIPTNVGRANERDYEAQAEFEAQSLWTYKKDRKYSDTQDGAEEPLLLPMLAKSYKKEDVGGWLIQKKLNGLRLLTYKDDDDSPVLLSRSGKPYSVPHIMEALIKDLPKGCMLDGELYAHGLSLQTITSLVKKTKPETSKLEYHIYDMPIVYGNEALPFKERLLALNDLKLSSLSIKKVETLPVSSLDDARDMETRFVEEGFEGAMLRSKDGVYRFGYRSGDLLKLKSFQDNEFLVIDCLDGVGKFKNHGIFVCKNDINDETFTVVPACSMEERAEFFENKNKYIGRYYTAKHFGRSDGGLPFIPTGLAFRDEKDLDPKVR